MHNGEPVNPNVNLYKTGYAIGQPFGLQALGLFANAADIAASPVPLDVSIKPGDIKYKDIGGPDGIIDGNDATTTYPRLSADGNQNNYRYFSFWQRDGSFIKLRSAEIGYTFSAKSLKTFSSGINPSFCKWYQPVYLA